MKLLNKELTSNGYGSILIHYRNGNITGVQLKRDFNDDALSEYLEKPRKRILIKKTAQNSAVGEKPCSIEQNCTEMTKNVPLSASSDSIEDTIYTQNVLDAEQNTGNEICVIQEVHDGEVQNM
jgi:hypothetical protein